MFAVPLLAAVLAAEPPPPVYRLQAAALLHADPADPAPPAHPDEWWVLRRALVDEACRLEVFDRPQAAYFFADPAEYANDLRAVRRRVDRLRDAPPLADAARFGPHEAADAARAFNRAFAAAVRARLDGGWEADRADLFRAVLAEADHLHALWGYVRDATHPTYTTADRREALLMLRANLGARAYEAGALPPAVPTWRFQDR